MKKVLILFTVIIMCLTSACSGGISGDDAKSFVNDFLSTVADGDYAEAENFLHPDRHADLQKFFEDIEKEKNVDFSIMKFERYTGIKSVVYDSSVDGSTYSLDMDITVSDKPAEFEIELVKNDNGYGIYNFDIDFD